MNRDYIENKKENDYNDSEIRTSLFIHMMNQREGFRVSRANPYQDKHEHWDVYVTKIYSLESGDFHSFKIDLKNFKSDFMESQSILIELVNIRGNIGWMYGKADGFAFERENDFFYVRREDILNNIVKGKVKNWDGKNKGVIDWGKVIKHNNYKPNEVYYELINRKVFGNDDIFFYMPYKDIEPFIISVIPKDPTKEIEILRK